jgi:hypothetical protein
MLSEAVPGDSMDPTHAATVIVASPAWDLVVAVLVVVVEASEVVVEASEVAVEAAEVAAVVAGERGEPKHEITGAPI